jgi:hypothetical protein
VALSSLSVLLEVVEHEVQCCGFLAVVLDGDRRGTPDSSGNSGLVVLALAEPLSQVGSLLHLNQRDVVCLAQLLWQVETSRNLL